MLDKFLKFDTNSTLKAIDTAQTQIRIKRTNITEKRKRSTHRKPSCLEADSYFCQVGPQCSK